MVGRFPLFSLPDEAMLNVFRSIDPHSLLLLSLCSKRTKALVKSRNIIVDRINVRLPASMFLFFFLPNNTAFNLEVICDNFNRLPMDIEKVLIPGNVRVDLRGVGADDHQRFITFTRKMTPRQWLDHFLDILNHLKIDMNLTRGLGGQRGNPYIHDIPKMKNFLNGLNVRSIDVDDIGFFYSTLSVLPDLEQLDIDTYKDQVPKAELQTICKIFSLNFDYIICSSGIPFDLNQLLLVNSISIQATKPILPDKDINRFIKCWMKGTNKRLEYLYLDYDYDDATTLLDKDIILQGIKHVKVDEERMLKLSVDVDYVGFDQNIEKGYDIRRIDGTKATIEIDLNYFYFKMFVWP